MISYHVDYLYWNDIMTPYNNRVRRATLHTNPYLKRPHPKSGPNINFRPGQKARTQRNSIT